MNKLTIALLGATAIVALPVMALGQETPAPAAETPASETPAATPADTPDEAPISMEQAVGAAQSPITSDQLAALAADVAVRVVAVSELQSGITADTADTFLTTAEAKAETLDGLRTALMDNAAVSSALEEAGYGEGDIVTAALDDSGTLIVYVDDTGSPEEEAAEDAAASEGGDAVEPAEAPAN